MPTINLQSIQTMLDYIKGQLVECNAAYAVIECNGVGFMANISLGTYTAIKDQQIAKLYIHEAIREDAYNLYGFATTEEREMFRLLISVSGVGANTGRIILSAYPTAELKRAIETEDVNSIKSIKGIGLKTAQRIIVEIKDKMAKLELGGSAAEGELFPVSGNKAREDSLAALEALGYQRSQATKVVDKLLKDNPEWKVEQVVKAAFKML